MFCFFRLWFGALARLFRFRRSLLLEMALRQQLTVLKRKQPKLSSFDKLFSVVARRFWPAWEQSLIVVTPETVVRWHRAGFRMEPDLQSKTASWQERLSKAGI